MLQLLIVRQFVSIGRLSTKLGDESTQALLHHIRKFEPIRDPLPKTSFDH